MARQKDPEIRKGVYRTSTTNHRKIHSKLLSFLLFIFTLITVLTQKAIAKKPRCPLPNDNPFFGINSTLYKLTPKLLAEIERDFVIFANAPLESVEYLIFTEMHGSHRHKRLQKKNIPLLSTDKDYLLLESVQHLKRTPCPDDFKVGAKLRKTLICLGWDNPKEASREEVRTKVLKIAVRYNDIFSKKLAKDPRTTLSNIKNLLSLNVHSQPGVNYGIFDYSEISAIEMASVNPVMFVNFVKHEMKIANRIANVMLNGGLSEELLSRYAKAFGREEVIPLVKELKAALAQYDKNTDLRKRNAYAMQTFSELACQGKKVNCQRKLMIGGAKHFFDFPRWSQTLANGEEYYHYKGAATIEEKRELFFSKMAMPWKKHEPHAEIRDYLETKRYAIFYPSNG